MILSCIVFLVTCLTGHTRAVEPAYQTEVWLEGRTLVWAHPGQGGQIDDPNNWATVSGDAVTTPPDRNTDIVLPAAEQLYIVKGGRVDQVRHVTIENLALLTGSHRNEVEIWGNCWVKAGGYVKYVSIRGDKHTFFRLDKGVFPTSDNGLKYMHPSRRVPFEKQCRSQISHKFQVCKYGTASVEMIGNIGASDEVMLQHGKMIISGDFRFSGVTGKGAFEIYDGGILELQSGARIAPFDPSNRKCVYNMDIYRNGVIQAGSPERPLTEDAYLLLGFAENDKSGRTGLYSAVGSMIRVYSEDPTRARLVISSTSSVADFYTGLGDLVGNPTQKAEGNKGIAMQLAGDIQLDGVVFDYVSLGGMSLADPNVIQQWQHVTYGPHCAATPDKLVSPLTVNANAYYHDRGADQASEYALTVTAMKNMADYLEQADPFALRTEPANTQTAAIGKGKQIQVPVAVMFEESIHVTIHSKVPGARIRYTTDGSEPTKESPQYTDPITLDKTTKILVKAYKPGMGFSPTYSTTYVFK
ncbi:MAG: chitobiase/beta-hexosaminidase C-terminal domain-containing protein [Phycisphaerae bacterium]|nr:chitobiase/beta-hexosaminidase C-terminal domain-containing protein [Phycisphaerae bacterium]